MPLPPNQTPPVAILNLPGKAGRLVEIYNQIDRLLQQIDRVETGFMPFSRRVSRLAETNNAVREYRHELMLLADIRNIIIHESMGNLIPVVEPHPELIEQLERVLVKLEKPPVSIEHIALQASAIYTIRRDTKLTIVMKHMQAQGFSHVPIIDSDRVVGVFSEKALFAYLVENGMNSLTPQLSMRDMWEVVKLGNRSFQRERYRFVARTVPIPEIEDLFWKHTKQNRRLAVIFVTENGDRNEHLLGMLTAADIAGYRDDR